jgi:hypothetical protein
VRIENPPILEARSVRPARERDNTLYWHVRFYREAKAHVISFATSAAALPFVNLSVLCGLSFLS